MSLPVIVIGSGGHAKVVIDTLLCAGRRVIGRTDRDPGRGGIDIQGVPFLGDDAALSAHDPAAVELANGIGSTGDPSRRIAVFETFRARGFRFTHVIHPSAVIAADAEIGEGAQIMAGAIVQPGCRIGGNVIVNTGAQVDHDCAIGEHVHVAPGAVLCGEVTIGARSHVGAGAVVIQRVRVGEDCLAAAGAVVINSVADGTRVAGTPAQRTPAVRTACLNAGGRS